MTEDLSQLSCALEAILFVAGEPLPPARIAACLGCEPEQVEQLAEALSAALQGRGLQLVRLAGGYSLATRSEYAEQVQALLQPDPQTLSVQALETLAIIAYRQPITRPEVDALRGCNSAGCINSLIEKSLIKIAGRKDAPGRPFLLETTQHFLSCFGLNDLCDLPPIDQFEAAFRSRQLQVTDGEPPEEAPAGEGEPLSVASQSQPSSQQ